jgi:hypothetical protein
MSDEKDPLLGSINGNNITFHFFYNTIEKTCFTIKFNIKSIKILILFHVDVKLEGKLGDHDHEIVAPVKKFKSSHYCVENIPFYSCFKNTINVNNIRCFYDSI